MDTRATAHLAVVCKLQYYIATNRSVDRSVNHPWSSGLSSLEYATDIHKFYKLIIYLHEGCFAAIISDVNECTSLTHDCHSDAICSNTDGAFTCSCYLGYTGDGQQCSGMFFFFFITIKLYYSRFKFVLFWYQWPFTAFLFFFKLSGNYFGLSGQPCLQRQGISWLWGFYEAAILNRFPPL